MPALAYLLTFSTCGTLLPGSEKGWVDAQHSPLNLRHAEKRGLILACSPMLPFNSKRQACWRAHLNEIPWILEPAARQITLGAMGSVCSHRQWIAHAIHIRTTHVHAVITGDAAPERMLSDFNAYATGALRRALPKMQRRRYWANHGSTRYLWNEVSFRAAIDYVLNGQGERMACYCAA
jgi:REP element-mobilizing transposase RayT